MLLERIDHKSQGYDRLLDIFKDKPNILKLINIYLKQKDDLETTIYQLLNSKHLSDIDSVDDVYLDDIGDLVGEKRKGRDDANYRLAIIFRIGVNNSTATPNYLTDLLKTTTLSTEVKYFPHYPASYNMEFNGDNIPLNFLKEFQDSSAAGVNVGLIHNKDDLGWVCSEVGSIDPISLKSVLPETSAITGINAPEIYIENVNPAVPVTPPQKGDKLRQAFAFTEHIGNSSVDLVVNNGLDMSSSESMLIWWRTVGSYVYNFTPLFKAQPPSSGGQRQWYENTVGSSTNLNCDLYFTFTGFVEPSTAAITRINETGGKYYVSSLKSTPEVIDIFEYTGDGSLSQIIPHNLQKDPLCMFIQTKNGAKGVTCWVKGMPFSRIINNRSNFNIGAIFGGSIPTSSHITVGDIGGSFSPNTLGVEYVVLILADNPDEGITAGSYISSGIAGQEVDIGNEVGLLNIFRGGTSTAFNAFYSKLSGVTGKDASTTSTPLTSQLQQINKDGRKIVLGTQNTFTNDVAGTTHYWWNIADPESTIN